MKGSWRERLALTAAIGIAAAYLVLRIAFTLNPAAPVWSWVFVVAEVQTLFATVWLVFVSLRARRLPPAAAPTREAPNVASVDVLVCTYNEDLDIVRQTLRAAMALRAPPRVEVNVFVLDDGRRDEFRRAATEAGARYVTRERNTDFKAGNLNHGLAHGNGEIVLVLDADHVVSPDLLLRTLHRFDDERVALVQIPQVYYNLDSFQHSFTPHRGRMWHDSAFFQHVLQPVLDQWNAAFFVGTGGLLRRSALDVIGGFACGSVTEDIHTSLRIHAAGFRSVYVNEPLGYMLAPHSFLQYVTQRRRWAQGAMQVLRCENPLFRRGLTLRQRLLYFMTLGTYFEAYVRALMYLAPIIYLLGGPAPLVAGGLLPAALVVGRVTLGEIAGFAAAGRMYRPILERGYQFLLMPAFIGATHRFFFTKGLSFAVTPKGSDARRHRDYVALAPQVVLVAASVAAFGIGVRRVLLADGDIAAQIGLGLSTLFVGLLAMIGSIATLFALERMRARSTCSLLFQTASELVSGDARRSVLIVRANESELKLACVDEGALVVGADAELHLSSPTEPVVCALGRIADVVPVEPNASGIRCVITLKLGTPSLALRDALFDDHTTHALGRLIGPLSLGARQLPSSTGVFDIYLPTEGSLL